MIVCVIGLDMTTPPWWKEKVVVYYLFLLIISNKIFASNFKLVL